MEFGMGGSGNSSDEQEASNARKGRKSYHRHTAQQIQQLEMFFKDCPHPDESQRRQLSRELGLAAKQIKFWFQNKRTQTKAQNERADNSVLRAENERIQCENIAIREALKNVICPSCGGPPFGEEERQQCLHKLQLENSQLKEEHCKVASLLAKYSGKSFSIFDPLASVPKSPLELSAEPFPNVEFDNNAVIPFELNGVPDIEKSLMLETAISAMDEVVKLFRINEPLWMKSPADGRYVLDHDSYDKIFPRPNHFKSTNARIESSKDLGLVSMTAMQLVDIFLDSDKWMDLFATIVTKASTIQVIESGMSGNRHGALQLMYGKMHILSPLVPDREYYFLRTCQQIELGIWLIVDVSYDFSKEPMSPSRSWKLPSGCMIQDMSNGYSKIGWIEHVAVDDKAYTHKLFRNLINSGLAYGAARWIVTLQRMCERFTFSAMEIVPPHELIGVISSVEGRRSVMKLGHNMVKKFCAILSMNDNVDFPHFSEVNNSGVQISVREATEICHPNGTIISATTSFWLPLSCVDIFSYFRDEKTRIQWDVLSNGSPTSEIVNISTASYPGNTISIVRPYVPTEHNMVILQETCIDPLGAMIIYAPIDLPSMTLVISGEDCSHIPILPSGFIITTDARPDAVQGPSSSTSASRLTGGSLLTVAFQIVVTPPEASRHMNMESVATVNTLINSTVQKIKADLNCSGLE